MATDVILPALGMAQETGKIVRWLKQPGDLVAQGEPLVEIETDKATVEIEAPASGKLAGVLFGDGSEAPVGQVIASIVPVEDRLSPVSLVPPVSSVSAVSSDKPAPVTGSSSLRAGTNPTEGRFSLTYPPPTPKTLTEPDPLSAVSASPLAARIAAENGLDLRTIPITGKHVRKADVLAYMRTRASAPERRLLPASPKARRLARERGLGLPSFAGSGPEGAVLAIDVLAKHPLASQPPHISPAPGGDMLRPTSADGADGSSPLPAQKAEPATSVEVSNIWRIMAERTTQSWTTVPHFYLGREINASRLVAWRESLKASSHISVTYTDLLVVLVARSLRLHPRVNAAWEQGQLFVRQEVNIGLAMAVDAGLVVPVIHHADKLSVLELANARAKLVAQAREGKLRPKDLADGTFTISNLGMYGVDGFNAIINTPQAAILAVGRIVDRVVPMHGQPAIQPMLALTLSCDHRAVDGARAAQFLTTLAELSEEPLGLLNSLHE